jgi:catechol 2,3-dioxygenase-like lactoylglutathione lyase family enzyme
MMGSMSRAVQVTFDAHDPIALSRFWADVLGYVNPPPPGRSLRPGEDPFDAWREFLAAAGVPESEWNTASAAEDPDGDGPRLFFQRVPEGKTAKNRVHLDVRVAPGMEGEERMAALEAEGERLAALGARRLERFEPAPPMSSGYLVMADPEGNEFCVA